MKKTILLLTMASFSAMSSNAANTIKPISLIELKKDNRQYIGICKAAESACKDGAKIWKEKNSNDNFYLTTTKLQFIKVRKESDGYSKVNMWDFSKNNKDKDKDKDKDINDDELTRDGVYIYPALYPLNKTKLAIALVSKWSASYSGGGRDEEYADFMMLNDDGSYQLAFSSIPFSSNEMIRACFSADDYAKKSHCHDENWSILSLKITDKAKAFYSWTFITKSYSWPAFTGKASIQMKTDESIAYPFQAPPQSDK